MKQTPQKKFFRSGGTPLPHIPLLQPRTFKFAADEVCAQLLGIPPVGQYDPWAALRQAEATQPAAQAAAGTTRSE